MELLARLGVWDVTPLQMLIQLDFDKFNDIPYDKLPVSIRNLAAPCTMLNHWLCLSPNDELKNVRACQDVIREAALKPTISTIDRDLEFSIGALEVYFKLKLRDPNNIITHEYIVRQLNNIKILPAIAPFNIK